MIKQLTTVHVFHDEKDLCRCLYHLIQADNVRVSKQFENFDLTTNFCIHLTALNLLTVQNFDGDLVSRYFMLGHCTHTYITAFW